MPTTKGVASSTYLRLELLQHLNFLLLITRRLARLLLSLIIHHLLDHTPRLSIQITQLRVLRCDLGDVYLRRRGNNMCPPFHLVDFIQVQF